jgi:hypothetical protein
MVAEASKNVGRSKSLVAWRQPTQVHLAQSKWYTDYSSGCTHRYAMHIREPTLGRRQSLRGHAPAPLLHPCSSRACPLGGHLRALHHSSEKQTPRVLQGAILARAEPEVTSIPGATTIPAAVISCCKVPTAAPWASEAMTTPPWASEAPFGSPWVLGALDGSLGRQTGAGGASTMTVGASNKSQRRGYRT